MGVAPEAIGPAVTLVVWLAIYAANHDRIAFVEGLAVIGGLVMLQLLLDLHTRHLGDIVIGALHVAAAIALLVRKRKARRAARPGALDGTEDG